MKRNFDKAVNDYMKDHAVFFRDPEAVAKHLKARLIDDALRAAWMDAISQASLHLRFLWCECLRAPPGLDDDMEKWTTTKLLGHILKSNNLRAKNCLAIQLGVYNIRIVNTMIANIKCLHKQLGILTPYHRLKGFERILMSDQSVYEMPLVADKKEPGFAEDGVDNAVAALYTILHTVPLGNLWVEKYEELKKEIKEEMK